jgi:predicted esterase
MSPNEHKIAVNKTARYYTQGNDITKAKRIWFVCHGYGQLAGFFIRNFNSFNPDTDFVIAPEGFHRFYNEGFSGRVGATWMTREARLDDIDDYIAFLNSVHDACGLGNRNAGQELIAFGFSQGVATISRWIALGNARPDAAVMWAGSFPPDLEIVKARNAFVNLPVYFVLGDADPFITDHAVEDMKKHLEPIGIQGHWIHFAGVHEIPETVLKDLHKAITGRSVS